MNNCSSRSHCVLSLTVEQIDLRNGGDNVIISKLQMVDLAGSERAAFTGNQGALHSKEAIEINKSLFTLRQVITALTDNKKAGSSQINSQQYVPYRDSKLTCLLK
mmetsp:Transcript_34173/g.33355  ORF Transcript_34173/g.33355 Transcript_34173/m.33355 type:complete len:105 (+) Transcript_34173:683-997(+)